ncbi:MAG: Holliday junction branch migration protein RuvA, partial [Hyphomicrobiales bacterium]|nr:Holliday junction branch migration protein RuvA [Hyphomicrobiales bacterium]
ALAILSTLDPGELASAVASRDKAQLQRATGVGGRLAERLVTELKDKAPAFAPIDPLVARLAGAVEAKAGLPQPVADAISALTNLGYAPPQASAAVAVALKAAGENPAASQLIKLGLRELAR